MGDLNTMFEQQNQLKWNHCLQRIKMLWIKPLKEKKVKTIFNASIDIENESNRKPNKLQVDQGREFYNKLIPEWIDNDDILVYFTHNEGKSVIAKRLIETLRLKYIKNNS